MKYFIRKRKDCKSSFCLQGGGGKMEAERKKKRFFFGNYCVHMCVTNGGEVRGLGVGGNGRWKKCRKRRLYVESLWRRKFEEVKLSLLEI